MSQTVLTCSTVPLIEGRHLCGTTPQLVPAALGCGCLKKMGPCWEVSRAVLLVDVQPALKLECSSATAALGGGRKSFKSRRKEALIT